MAMVFGGSPCAATGQAEMSTRCTTDVPTPTVRPILRMPMPSALGCRIDIGSIGNHLRIKNEGTALEKVASKRKVNGMHG